MLESPEVLPLEKISGTDLFIAGGGLAGLSLSIQLARAGFRVCLAEKERYPFHRVCGEYISMESWDFLEGLGLPLSAMSLPRITQLTVTAPNGTGIDRPLPLGGFGISRYTLDLHLAQIAREVGVELLEDIRVLDMQYGDDQLGTVGPDQGESDQLKDGQVHIQTSAGAFRSRVAVGSFGKRSNLDLRWQRPFVQQKPGPLNNYIGVKYHIEYDFPKDRIALHNFADGYCGISAVEDNHYCLCYLTTANNLRKSGGSLKAMEASILSVNPHLRDIFSRAKFLWDEPVTISQVSFARKELVRDHILFCGDAAGMITPLCGNGMSMALHGSKILARLLEQLLQGNISREEMESAYTLAWNRQFGTRLRVGRAIQSLFGKPGTTNAFIQVLKPFPGVVSALIRGTHGRPF
jgi:flavin-dependent dehydrogenase